MTRTSVVLIAVLTLSSVVRAQPAPNPAADAAYQEARRLYDLREWDAAIAKFKEAYRLRPDAPSLFNIAQSNRLKGDCSEALSFYKTYRRNFPTEKNIDKVDKFIADMDACVKTGTKTEPTKTEPTRLLVTEPSSPADPGHGKRIAGYVVGGVGVVALGVGVLFAIRAHSLANDASNAMPGETWDPSIQTRGQNAAKDAKISLGLGAALVVTGGVLYVLGRKSSGEASHVAVLPKHDGASLVWASEF